MTVDPKFIEALVVRAQVADARGQQAAAQRHYFEAARSADELIEGMNEQEVSPEFKGEVAWLRALHLSQYDEAEKMARDAMEQQADVVTARRTLGAVQLVQEHPAEAEQMLEPIARSDTWSAILLARTFNDREQKDKAAEQLRLATRLPANFEQRKQIAALAEQWGVEMPTTQPVAGLVRRLLDTFRPEVLDYPFHPEEYLSFDLRIDGSDKPVGMPWECSVKLQNKGTFPITIGPAMMIESELLCLVKTFGDRRRSSGRSLRTQVNRRLQLQPGEVLEIPQTLKIGPIRAGMIGTPQMSHEVEVSALLNPVMRQGGQADDWQPGVGGLKAGPVKFRRLPFVASRVEMGRLLGRSQSENVTDRIEATQLLAMLLGEQQHLAAGRLQYSAQPIDVPMVRTALIARASDTDWRVRARLAEAMRWFVVDSVAMQGAMKLINDQHWLVRGLARRMLVEQFAAKFESVLEGSAASDPDPWVRRFSKALLGRLSLAESAEEDRRQPDMPATTMPAQNR